MVVIKIWDKLRGKLETTPVEHQSSLQESFENVFVGLRRLNIDISPLEARVNELFQKACEYDEVMSTVSKKMSNEA